MTNDPVLQREFTAAIETLNDKHDESHAQLMRAMADGFSSIEKRLSSVDAETKRLSDLAIKQAEINGFNRGVIANVQKDIQAAKDQGDRHNTWLVGTLGTTLLMLVGVIINWFRK